MTPEEVLHAHPELYPFKSYTKRHDLHKDPFAAIFILHDPVRWAEEIQVLCDLVEGGVLATHPQHAHRKQVGAVGRFTKVTLTRRMETPNPINLTPPTFPIRP